jgi:hypothetical protein
MNGIVSGAYGICFKNPSTGKLVYRSYNSYGEMIDKIKSLHDMYGPTNVIFGEWT